MKHTAREAIQKEAELARLRWQCRRGMRELDVLLMRYFDNHYATSGEIRQQAFEALLALSDPVILAYLTDKQTPPQAAIRDVIQQLTLTGH